MSMTVSCLDIAFYSHISTDRKYDNMIMVIMQGYRCKGKVKRLVSSQWVFLLMGVVHWLDESAPKIAKRDICRGACTLYHAVGLWHCFKPCWCCLIAVLDVLFENIAGILLYYSGINLGYYFFHGSSYHCIKWVACHFARLRLLVVIPYTSPFRLLKSRQKRSPATYPAIFLVFTSTSGRVKCRKQERSPAMSMPAGCV